MNSNDNGLECKKRWSADKIFGIIMLSLIGIMVPAALFLIAYYVIFLLTYQYSL